MIKCGNILLPKAITFYNSGTYEKQNSLLSSKKCFSNEKFNGTDQSMF